MGKTVIAVLVRSVSWKSADGRIHQASMGQTVQIRVAEGLAELAGYLVPVSSADYAVIN